MDDSPAADAHKRRCMFSSTKPGRKRNRAVPHKCVKDRFFVAAGLLVIIAVCISNLAVIRWLSKLGFIVSFLLLLILVAKLNIGASSNPEDLTMRIE